MQVKLIAVLSSFLLVMGIGAPNTVYAQDSHSEFFNDSEDYGSDSDSKVAQLTHLRAFLLQ